MPLGIRLLLLCSIFRSSFGASLRTAPEDVDIEYQIPKATPGGLATPADNEEKPKESSEQYETDIAEIHSKNIEDKVLRETRTFSDKAKKVSVVNSIKEDLDRFADTFFPGKRIDLLGRKFEFMIVALAIAWFFLYTRFLYQDDRRADFSHWSASEVAIHEEADNTLRPDIVLVFSHPNLKRDELDTDDILMENEIQRRDSVILDAEHPEGDKSMTAASICGTMSDKVATGKTNLPRLSRLASGEEASLLQVRKSLLRDLAEILPEQGIQVGMFSSYDGDELFVTLVLADEKWVRHYVKRDGLKLQLTPELIKDLDVHEPAKKYAVSLTSPPFFRYDHRLAAEIYDEHGTGDVEDSRVYKTYGASKSVLLGVGRIRIVTRLLMDYVDLDRAVEQNILVKWYPCHGEIKLRKLQQYWGNWRLIADLSCVQPLPLIQEYFSSRVAFVFAWNGMYSKYLLALLPVAMLFWFSDTLADWHGRTTGVWSHGTVLGFSLIVAYWAKFVDNQWRREETYLRVLWDLEDIGQDAAVRPDFHGEDVPSPIDEKATVQEYPGWKFRLRCFASWAVTLMFCACVVTFVLAWMDQFTEGVDLMGSSVLALMIQVFTFVFNRLVEVLTIQENHKLQRTFYESYLSKMFVFEFINQYTAFFYIALKQQHTVRGCPLNGEGEKDCLLALKHQLPETLCVLMLVEIVEVLLANVKVRALLQWEHFTNERKRTHSYLQALRTMCYGREDHEEDATTHMHNFVEAQAKFCPYRTREQIETMTKLCLNLGFALIFGGVVPIVVPMVLLAFVVQLRAKATLLTTATDRPVPRRIAGLGPWLDIVELLMGIAVVFNAYVLVDYGPLFKNLPLLSKLTGFILYIFVVKALWNFHDTVSPARCYLGDLLRQRRELVISKLLAKVSENRHAARHRRNSGEVGRGYTNFVEEAILGEWHKIPPISRIDPEILHRMGLQ